MSTMAPPRRVATSTVLVAGIGIVAVAAMTAHRLAGSGGYLTDPLAAGSWAVAAVLADLARSRLHEADRVRAARFAGALAVSLLVGLLTGVAAISAASGGGPLAPVVIAVWSVTWIPPLVLSQLVASSAVRAAAGRSPAHVLVLVTSAAGMVAGLLLWQPSAPFTGVATIAPEQWPTRVAVVGDVVTVLGLVALVVLPVALLRAALTSCEGSRARLAVAAAGTLASPLVVVFCLLLAIARDPGNVDPTAGSVAFQVAVAGGTSAAAICGVLAARGQVDTAPLTIALRAAALAVGALLVAAVGTLVAAASLPPTAVALIVAAVAVGVAAIAWWGAERLATTLAGSPAPSAPAGPSAPASVTVQPDAAEPGGAADRLSQLTRRELEVLALLAEGSSNAGIAAQLVVSERTVDAHLRSVFTKLDLRQDPAANRRVQAARQWLDDSVRAE